MLQTNELLEYDVLKLNFQNYQVYTQANCYPFHAWFKEIKLDLSDKGFQWLTSNPGPYRLIVGEETNYVYPLKELDLRNWPKELNLFFFSLDKIWLSPISPSAVWLHISCDAQPIKVVQHLINMRQARLFQGRGE